MGSRHFSSQHPRSAVSFFHTQTRRKMCKIQMEHPRRSGRRIGSVVMSESSTACVVNELVARSPCIIRPLFRLCLITRAPSAGMLEGKNVGTPTRPVPTKGTGLDFVRSFESLGGVQGNVFYLLFLGVIWGSLTSLRRPHSALLKVSLLLKPQRGAAMPSTMSTRSNRMNGSIVTSFLDSFVHGCYVRRQVRFGIPLHLSSWLNLAGLTRSILSCINPICNRLKLFW
jgi:hypothetical protein